MKTYSYQQWYDIYCGEVDNIIGQYTAFIMDGFQCQNMYHSLDIEKFKHMMKHYIYKTSINKEKSILWL